MEDQKVKETVDKLAEQVMYSGFREIISNKELELMVSEGLKEYVKPFEKKYPGGDVYGDMQFAQGKNGEYYFNAFHLQLKKEDGSEVSRDFRNTFGNSFTLKEAYNLLDGRSVFKEFVPMRKKDETTGELLDFDRDENGKLKTYTAWARLDFTEKDKNGDFLLKRDYNINLDAKLKEYPIKELDFQQSFSDLKNTLEKGNRPGVTFVSEYGGEERKYVEMNSKYGQLQFYSDKMEKEHLTPKLAATDGQVVSNKVATDNTQQNNQQNNSQGTESVKVEERKPEYKKKAEAQNSEKKEKVSSRKRKGQGL